jgi:hypothetical protein
VSRCAFRFVVAVVASLCLSGTASTLRAADEEGNRDASALRELLEGPHGREQWDTLPSLVILSSVMEYSGADVTAGYQPTAEHLTMEEVEALETDMTAALSALTGGRAAAFSSVRVEEVAPGQTVKMFRRGQIVVGRFDGVRQKTGTVGYGGRTTRNAVITAGAVILDADYDRSPARRLALRMHELGHALGYNHVASRQSVMNARVGSALTDFDRAAMDRAFADATPHDIGLTARLTSPGDPE